MVIKLLSDILVTLNELKHLYNVSHCKHFSTFTASFIRWIVAASLVTLFHVQFLLSCMQFQLCSACRHSSSSVYKNRQEHLLLYSGYKTYWLKILKKRWTEVKELSGMTASSTLLIYNTFAPGSEDPPKGEGLGRGGIKGTSLSSEANQTCTLSSLHPLSYSVYSIRTSC